MKKILLQILVLGSVLLGSLFVGCSDNDDPFAGTDNYILSFSLTKDNVTYEASIIENKLEISVPRNVDLTGATVSYKLTELASVSPNPAEVSNWNDAQEFTVQSHNRTSRKYTYSVNHTNIANVGTVTLLTQADIDQFAASNTEVIEGNLVIGSNETVAGLDTIKHLEGLQSLKTITNNLTIYNSFGGKSLDGLKNLESVGNIYIRDLTTRSNVEDSLDIALPNLTKVGDLYVSTPLLLKLHLPKLTTAFSFYLNSPSLTEINCASLQTVITDFGVESGTSFTSYATTTNKKLQQLSLSNLKEVQGAFVIRGMAALSTLDVSQLAHVGTNFTINLVALEKIDAPHLQSIKQALSLKNTDSMEELSLPQLTTLGSMEYSPTSNKKLLEKLTLTKLTTVEGDLKMDYLNVKSLDLPSLKSVSKQINIRFGALMETINMPLLEECNNIYFYSLPLVTSLDLTKVNLLDKLELISCYKLSLVKAANNITNVILNGGSRLCDLTRLEGIDKISGNLELFNYTQNSEFNFPGLKHIGGKYKQSDGLENETVVNFPDLETIDELNFGSAYLKEFKAPKLTTVGTWNTSYWSNVENGKIHIPNLKKIGTFKFYGGTYAGVANQMKLTNLNDFASVEEIESVEIKWWGKMTDFSGLKKIFPAIKKENWKVEGCAYNPTYDDMVAGKYTN